MTLRNLVGGFLAALIVLLSRPLHAQISIPDGVFSGSSSVWSEIDSQGGTHLIPPPLEKIWPEYNPSTNGGNYLYIHKLDSAATNAQGVASDVSSSAYFSSAFTSTLWTLKVDLGAAMSFTDPLGSLDQGASKQTAQVPFTLLSRATVHVSGSESLVENFPTSVVGSGIFLEDAASGAILERLDLGARNGTFANSSTLSPGSYLLVIQNAPMAHLTTKPIPLNESSDIQVLVTVRSLP